MPKRTPNTANDSDSDDAPERVTQKQSKEVARAQAKELQEHQAAEIQRRKAKNRERDSKLKERAEVTRGHAKKRPQVKGALLEVDKDVSDEEEGELEARMRRAMQDAQEEMDGDVDDKSDDDYSGEEDEDFLSDNDMNVDADAFEGFGSASNSDSEPERPRKSSLKKSSPNPNHLPEHIFITAFASHPPSVPATSTPSSATPKPLSKRKNRITHNSKDQIIGSRVVRTLATHAHPEVLSAKRAQPSRKVRRFLDRSLHLKGAMPKGKGWERKSANLGVFKRDGPAASFVRTQ